MAGDNRKGADLSYPISTSGQASAAQLGPWNTQCSLNPFPSLGSKLQIAAIDRGPHPTQ